MRSILQGQGTRSPIWGDGFAEDGWLALNAVKSAAELHPDECARLFPRLAARGGEFPTVLVDRVVAITSARADHLGCAGAVHNVPYNLVAWTVAGAAADFCFLKETAQQLKGGCAPLLDEDQRARFAFLTQVHPGYFWPESIASVERDAAAAWLGILASGRPALMTSEVAHYFTDVIDSESKWGRAARARLKDKYIASLASHVAAPSHLLTAARDRHRGRDRPVWGLMHPIRRSAHQKFGPAAKTIKRCVSFISDALRAPQTVNRG